MYPEVLAASNRRIVESIYGERKCKFRLCNLPLLDLKDFSKKSGLCLAIWVCVDGGAGHVTRTLRMSVYNVVAGSGK